MGAASLPVEALEVLERHLGREDARLFLKSLEQAIAQTTVTTWARERDAIFDYVHREVDTVREEVNLLRQDLATMRQEMATMRREMVTRELLDEKLASLRHELMGKIEAYRQELLGKIEATRLALDRKMTLWFWILLFAIFFTNREAIDLILRLLGIAR